MPRWRKMRTGRMRPGDAVEAVSMLPDPGNLDELGVAALVLLGIVVAGIVVVPLLLFGVELIVLGLLVAAGILGRTLVGRPWIVQAAQFAGGSRELSWQVVGWRRSNGLIEEVRTSLEAGLEPSPAAASELIAMQ